MKSGKSDSFISMLQVQYGLSTGYIYDSDCKFYYQQVVRILQEIESCNPTYIIQLNEGDENVFLQLRPSI